jgi:hypothetical protein
MGLEGCIQAQAHLGCIQAQAHLGCIQAQAHLGCTLGSGEHLGLSGIADKGNCLICPYFN